MKQGRHFLSVLVVVLLLAASAALANTEIQLTILALLVTLWVTATPETA